MTPEPMTLAERLRAMVEAATAHVDSRLRRIEERQEWQRRHSRPETPHERERRERGLW